MDELFALLGIEAPASKNEAVVFMQPRVRGDHATPDTMPTLAPDQDAHARKLYKQMGLVDE